MTFKANPSFLMRAAIFYLLLTLMLMAQFQSFGQGFESQFSRTRKSFETHIVKEAGNKSEIDTPPAELFSIVEYPSNIGNMAAYLSKIPNDQKLHPAIIWIVGGFGNAIGDVWSKQPASNDQSASVIREAGIIMMYPSQRGGNHNPGRDETCFGEIDDILAAANYLSKQAGIDTNRIYLGGHSTGGTKVLLAASLTNKFRAVFSLAPVSSVMDYGDEQITFDTSNKKEGELRAPINWLKSIATPVYVFEGTAYPSNLSSLYELQEQAVKDNNKNLHFYALKRKDHFSSVLPTCKMIAKKISEDNTGDAVTLSFGKELE